MKKRHVVYGIVIISIFLCIIGASNNYRNPKTISEKVQKYKLLEHTNSRSEVLVTVNNKQITNNDVKKAKLFREDNIDDNKMLQILINNELLYQQAKEEGLEVTLEEAKKEALNSKNQIEKYCSKEDKDKIKQIIDNLGISENKYWNEIVPNNYIKLMTIGNLKSKIKDNATKNISDPEKAEKMYRQALNNKIDELNTKNNIKIKSTIK